MDQEQAEARRVLEEALKETGLDPTGLARAVGVAPSTFTRFLNSPVKHSLSGRTLMKLQTYLGRGPSAPPVGATSPGTPPPLPQRHEMPRDVPVFGTAMGANGDGAFVMNMTGQIDTVRRGPGIMNNRGVFAIYVEGDSMTPRYEPGELVYLDKNRPIKPGDDVVLVMASPEKGVEPRAYLKRLVRRTADRWICEQFNPPGKVVEFPVEAMQDKFRVLRWQEVMGL